MKKNRAGLLFAAALFLAAVSANAAANQEAQASEVRQSETPETPEMPEQGLYEIIAENEAAFQSVKREMELRFEVYNRLFRFDPARLRAPLTVRVFEEKEAYDSYIAEKLGETKPGAVYLHYRETGRRELAICRSSPEAGAMTAHQAFIQFLRAFIANPPSWMREGFAIFFSTLRFNPSAEKLDYEENLLWLESAKSLGAALPSSEALLMADISGTPTEFQVSSWALVSFLLNGGRDYFRILTDSFMLLSPDAPAAENAEKVMERVSLWNDADAFDGDFKSYLDSRRTFPELMEDGRQAYSLGDLMGAELSFLTAMDQRPHDFAPYYYLGLLAYEGKDYELAEARYLASGERGADAALINYALGLNAAAAGRNEDSAGYLRRAADADPARYRAKAEELLRRLQNR